MKTWLTPLVCPACGEDVPPRATDGLLDCAGCGAVHEVRQGVAHRLELAMASEAAAASGERQPPGPWWCLDVVVTVTGPDDGRAAGALAGVDRVWVDAAAPFPGPGQVRGQEPVEFPSGARAPIPPCLRSSAAAVAWVRPTLLIRLDQQVDVTGLELQVEVKRTRLVLCPGAGEIQG